MSLVEIPDIFEEMGKFLQAEFIVLGNSKTFRVKAHWKDEQRCTTLILEVTEEVEEK